MIRARRLEHLQALQQRIPALAAYEPGVTPDSDYRYRIVVPKAEWTAALGALAEEQEWCNFKSEAARFQRRQGADYSHALHEVWEVMYRLQR